MHSYHRIHSDLQATYAYYISYVLLIRLKVLHAHLHNYQQMNKST
nr:MAG TPA: hypothetical protein [Crassvirales sp.]